MKGEQVVRMTPYKNGKANRGHSCVKGRFAFGYATHKERITTPMIRDTSAEFRLLGAPMKKCTWCKKWCGQASVTTT